MFVADKDKCITNLHTIKIIFIVKITILTILYFNIPDSLSVV